MNIHIDKRKELAIEAARAAGKILRENFGKVLKVKSKPDGSVVTDIDLKAEEKIVKLIKECYPEDNILSEETKYQTFGSDFRWVIDPLDGTHNFIRNIDIFGTSIALEFRREVVLGVIYMPITAELYVGQKGKGAHCNGNTISVSERSLKEATMVYDSIIRYNKKPMLGSLGNLVDKVFNVRMFGSTVRSLSYLAEGKVDLEIEYTDKAWDFAAGLLIVEEAGGKATDFQNRRWDTNTLGYVASNGMAHKEVLSELNKTH
jgi:myo-inositol-1(or 4)-monophosphatase